ncbi:MAG: hypothetical protein M1274_06915 [Actinobacteria bacterium]|nr:hypothetical protein [Actinomycetota bacterium]
MMRRHPVLAGLGTVFVVVALTIAVFAVAGRQDEGVEAWRGLRKEFAGQKPTFAQVVAPWPKGANLTRPDAEAFARALFSGTFASTNRSHEGPTASIVVLIQYEGYRQPVAPNQWPDGRFEITWNNVQFLVSSPELSRLLAERGFTY